MRQKMFDGRARPMPHGEMIELGMLMGGADFERFRARLRHGRRGIAMYAPRCPCSALID